MLALSQLAVAHVESGFFRSYTIDGYEIIYSRQPVRPNVGDTIRFHIEVKWWDVKEATQLLMPQELYIDVSEPGTPVEGLGAFVDIFRGYSQFVDQSKAALQEYQARRIFMSEYEPGKFDAFLKFDDPGSYKIRFLLTDADNIFQIDVHEENLQIEPKTVGKLFVSYALLFIGIAVILINQNTIWLDKLRGGGNQ